MECGAKSHQNRMGAARQKVLFHSDALLEVEDDKERPLGFPRLKRFLAEHRDERGASFLESVFALGLAHSGGHGYADDVTMILMETT